MSVLLKNLPKEELPRERLLKCGVNNLTNEELISILLRTGTVNLSVKDLANEVLSLCKNIEDMKDLTISKMKKIKGLGEVKAITLLAALELGRRVYDEVDLKPKITIKNAEIVFKYFAQYINKEKQENFLVIYLDNQKKHISHKILFKGTINQSVVHPREVFKGALLESASAIIVMHNHPSGNLTPSNSDDDTTRILAETGEIMGIPLLDHVIVSSTEYFSYLEGGRFAYE